MAPNFVVRRQSSSSLGRIQNMDHPMDLVHGPPDGPGQRTRSMDPVHGPPLIFKRKSPLLIRKFTGGQGMKNRYCLRP